MTPQLRVPGYNEPIGDWKEELVKGTESGRVLPIISNSLCNDLAFGGHMEVVRQLTNSIHYPLNQSDDLSRRMQYVAIIARAAGSSEWVMKESYLDFLEELLHAGADKDLWTTLQQEVAVKSMAISEKAVRVDKPAYDIMNPLIRLAALPLPIFLTTSYHSFLEVALTKEGKRPHTQICLWNGNYHNIPQSMRSPDRSYEPSVEEPLVFHLHGLDQYPESLVLTEDDYFDFIAAIMADKRLIPERIREALSGWSILLLGYDLRGWDFKVIFCSLLKPTDKGRRQKSISIQLSPDNKDEKNYLEKYLGIDTKFEVYWGEVQEFMDELWSAWSERG